MTNHPTTLEQFRSFCFQNKVTDLEAAVDYFAVFGGMGWTVDMRRPLDVLIEEKVFKNYRYIHGDITKLTQSDKTHHALLSGVALGDRREHSAFKRAGVSREEGEASIDFLVRQGLLVREHSQAKPVDESEEVSDKLRFTLPFMRFWFAAVSPCYKGVRDGDYGEVKAQIQNMWSGFSDLIYVELVKEMLKLRFAEDPLVEIGAYWDKQVEIDILGKTASGRIVAGSCKFSKSKAKKSELTRLASNCSQAEIEPDIFVLFSKSGFSSELKKEKGDKVKLFALKHLLPLMEDLGEKDLLRTTNKKY